MEIMALKVTVPGEPVPLARPRTGRYGNVYTPQRSLQYQRDIAWEARVQRTRFGSRDVIVHTDFFCRSKLAKDGDNMHKAVLDALEKAEVDDNDRQVVEGHYRVFRGVTKPRTEIRVYAVDHTVI